MSHFQVNLTAQNSPTFSSKVAMGGKNTNTTVALICQLKACPCTVAKSSVWAQQLRMLLVNG